MKKSAVSSKRNCRASTEVEAGIVSNTAVIETTGLWKRYDDVDALRGLDLRVPSGSIYGFLGRNGAGKTTTIKALMGLLRPDSGDARLFGQAIGGAADVETRRRISFVTVNKQTYPSMTVAK